MNPKIGLYYNVLAMLLWYASGAKYAVILVVIHGAFALKVLLRMPKEKPNE